jgi:L-malate glycosyltransferase
MTASAKISVLHISTPRTWRGGEQQVLYLMDALCKKNIDQRIVCTLGSEMEKRAVEKGLNVFALPRRGSWDPLFAHRISRIAKGTGSSVIHAHDAHAHTLAVMAASLFACKVPVVVSRRVDFPPGKSLMSRYKYNHPSVKKILCVSDAIRFMTAAGISDPAKAVTVHSGIDLSRFEGKKDQQILHREFGLSSKSRIVANVAAIAPHKDYFTFVDTCEMLHKRYPDLSFFIIGDGPLRNRIEQYVQEKNLTQVVYFTGFRTDIPGILPEIDVMLITSETEGLGTAILDAFACGVPVVATRAGGIPEIVHHEQTGLLAPVKSPSVLADEVTRLLKDDLLRSKLTSSATRYLDNFTFEATASKTLTEYLAVTGVAL